MPDAPPKKKRRTVSPDRVPCPLIPGTPLVPPPRIPQPWELKKAAHDALRRASRSQLVEDCPVTKFELVEEGAVMQLELVEDDAVPQYALVEEGAVKQLEFADDGAVMKSELAKEGEVMQFEPEEEGAVMQFEPEEQGAVMQFELEEQGAVMQFELEEEGAVTKSELLEEGAATKSELVGEGTITPPSPKKSQVVFNLSTGEKQEMNQNVLVDASIELVGFKSRTSYSAEDTLRDCSPEPSTSSTRLESSICEEGLEEQILHWESFAGRNPGSDIEDDYPDSVSTRVQRREFDVEDLPSKLCEVLVSMDRQDDCILRESSQEDFLKFDWSSDPQVFSGVRENFTGPSGPTFPTEGMSPFQVFTKIWDEDIINLIVEETNKYAANLLTLSQPQYSRTRRWTPITPQDLWTFFGLQMLQSIIPIPVQKEFWTPCLPYLKIGTIGQIMPYSRFTLIKKCLHFVDNSVIARRIPNKLEKIQPIIDHLNNKFSSLYLPEQEIVVDESLLRWSGRLSFSQLIATKAARLGIKSYELCESKTGYLWRMIIYTGKKEQDNVEANENEIETQAEVESASSRVVLNLVRPLLNKGYTLVMDNFYNSPLLARTLKAQKTDVMGTLRLTREFVPDSLRRKNKSNMRHGEVAFSQTRDMTISVWRDGNIVGLISTYHKVEVGGKEKYGLHRYKPKVVLDYNLAMGGVDRKDQLLQEFPIERIRNPIWYKKLFYRLLNVSVLNTFIMFTKSGTANMTQRQFRVLLADEIIKKFCAILTIPEPIPVNGHFPVKTNFKKSRCKWCAIKNVVARTVYKCEYCDVNLCIIGCFKEFHMSQLTNTGPSLSYRWSYVSQSSPKKSVKSTPQKSVKSTPKKSVKSSPRKEEQPFTRKVGQTSRRKASRPRKLLT